MSKTAVQPTAIGDDLRDRDLEILDDPERLFVAPVGLLEGSQEVALARGCPEDWCPPEIHRHDGTIALAVLGPGGSGKSYLCRRLARKFADLYQETKHGGTDLSVVPVYYPMRELIRNSDLLDVLARWVGCTRDVLTMSARQFRILFLLDTFDESEFGREPGPPDAIQELLQPLLDLPNASVLLTGRPAMFPGDTKQYLPEKFSVVHLRSWGPSEIEEYLKQCQVAGIDFGPTRDALYLTMIGKDGSSRLEQLAKTPLLARMIVQTRDDIANAANGIMDEYGLYEYYTRWSFDRKSGLIPVLAAEKFHGSVARSMYSLRTDSLSQKAIIRDLAVRDPEAVTLEEMRRLTDPGSYLYGLLVTDEKQQYRFSHLSFGHYFIAVELCETLQRDLCGEQTNGSISEVFDRAPLPQGAVELMGQRIARDQALKAALKNTLENCKAGSRNRLLKSGKSMSPAKSRRPVEKPGAQAFRNLVLLVLAAEGSSPTKDLSGLDFDGVDFTFGRSNRPGVDLRGCNLTNAKLRQSVLRGANLQNTKLVSAVMTGSESSNADLSGADLMGCNLAHVRVRDNSSFPRLVGVKNLDLDVLREADPETARLLEDSLRAGE